MTLKRPKTNNDVLFDQSFINANEAAAYLRISKQRFYNLTHMRSIPYFKFGKRILVKKEDLDSLLVKIEPVNKLRVCGEHSKTPSRFYLHTELIDRRQKNFRGKK